MDKSTLQQILTKQGVPFPRSATRSRLRTLLPGTKQVLRTQLALKGRLEKKELRETAKMMGVKTTTIHTALSDLQNPKYAGKEGPIRIERDASGYRLLPDEDKIRRRSKAGAGAGK